MSDLHDLSDDTYWRSLTPRQVLDLVAAQIDDSYRDAVDGYEEYRETPMEAIRQILKTAGMDIQDRAVDMGWCNKVDECRGKAAFLAWLAWHLDDGFLRWFEREADR